MSAPRWVTAPIQKRDGLTQRILANPGLQWHRVPDGILSEEIEQFLTISAFHAAMKW
jgi:hypothetical protein